MSVDFDSSYKHLQIEGSVSILNYISLSSISSKDQITFSRIIAHVQQLHAIYPMLSVFYKIGVKWQNEGVIPTTKQPWLAAMQYTLNKHNLPNIDVVLTHNLLKKQIHYAQNIISSFISDLSSNVVVESFQEHLLFASRQIEKIPEYLAFKDNLIQLSKLVLTKDYDDEFESAWATCRTISKTLSVEPPKNYLGGYNLPDIPRTIDDMHSSFEITHWVSSELIEETTTFLKSSQKEALDKKIPIPEFVVGNKNKLELSPQSKFSPFGVPSLKRKIKITGRIPLLSSTRFLCEISNGKNRTDALFISSGSKKLVIDQYPKIELKKASCEFCDNACSPTKAYIVDYDNGLMSVSSQCLNKFTGKVVDKVIGSAFDLLRKLKEGVFWDESEFNFRSKVTTIDWFPVRNFIMLADYFTTKYGFSRRDEKQPTRDLVLSAIRDFSNTDIEAQKIIENSFKSHSKYHNTDNILNFFVSARTDSSYMNYIKDIINTQYINLNNEDDTGALASTPSVYEKYTKVNNDISNEHFGQIKARGPLKLRVYYVEEKEDLEFPVVRYKMSDDLGRNFTWNATWPGQDELTPGTTVVLIGTIAEHRTWNGKNSTKINRCSDIRVVRRNEPIPDFFKSSVKRVFKQQFDFKLDICDSNSFIDGNPHLKITRRWLENNHIHTYQNTLPLIDSIGDFISKVIMDIAQQCGLERDITSKHKKDLKFIRELKMFLSSIPKINKNTLYLAEDAFSPIFSSKPENWGSPFSSKEENSLLKPNLFIKEENAIKYASQFLAGRVLSILYHPLKTCVIPIDLKLKDTYIQRLFKQRALESGYNAIVYINDDHEVKKIEPLFSGASLSHNEVTIIKDKPYHSNENKHKNHLANCSFVCVIGLTSIPKNSAMVKSGIRRMPTIRKEGEPPIIPELMYSESPEFGGGKTSVSLNYLCDEKSKIISKTGRLAVVTEESTAYYLRYFGGDVITVDGTKPKKHKLKSINQLQVVVRDFNCN